MDLSHLSDDIAGLHISTIALAALVLTLIRLGLVRSGVAATRGVAEFVEALLIAGVLVFMVIQPLIVKAFYIPSASMVPTLLINDHLAVNKLIYRLVPPHRDDVVVFVAPRLALEQAGDDVSPGAPPIDYIKRLIGLPGDVIEVRHGYVTVNGREETHSDLRRAFNFDSRNTLDYQHIKIVPNGLVVDDGTRVQRLGADQVAQLLGAPGVPVTFHPGVTLRNGQVLDEPFVAEDPGYDDHVVDGHSVLWDPDDEGQAEVDGNLVMGPQAAALEIAKSGPVPPGHVYVMGDNRNDSGDSTHWGPLAEDRLVGKASFIFWPFGRVRVIR